MDPLSQFHLGDGTDHFSPVVLRHGIAPGQNLQRAHGIQLGGQRYKASALILDGLDTEKTANFIERLMSMGHESPLEHISFTFGVEGVSRSLLAQLTRHRIASYSVKSQRYVNEGRFEFIIPKENEKDIDEIPMDIRKELEFYPVTTLQQVLDLALVEV